MDPMLKRRLHLATFFVLIPLALVVVTLFCVSTWLFRLVTPLASLLTAVTNGVRSWTLTDSDSHHHMTSMTLAPHQPTSNTAATALHHWSSTECGIGMILLITLLVCVSIIASRSLGKVSIGRGESIQSYHILYYRKTHVLMSLFYFIFMTDTH